VRYWRRPDFMMDAPLRFCFCTTFYPPYSGDADGMFVHALANGLASRGHQVTVIHSPATYEVLNNTHVEAPYSDHSNLVLRPIAVPLHKLGLLMLHQTGRPVGLRRQLEEAMSGPFDVIHFQNISLLGGPAIYGMGNSHVKIGGLNDHWLVCPMHLLWKYTGEVCDTPQCFTCCIRQGRPPQWWRSGHLLSEMAGQVDVFLGPSLFTMQKHLQRGFRRPMVHLPPLLALPHADELDVGDEPPRRPYFLCTGRLEVYKGFQDVIPLFQHFPEHDLVICGEGSFQASLRTLATSYPNVRVIGRQSPGALHALYRGAVATIVPSRCIQTFCHSTAESYAAGTPVIALRLSAVEEIVSRHGGGLLYDQPEQLRASMSRLLEDGAERSALAAQALQTYESEFSVESYLRRYLRIVRELLDGKQRGPGLFPPGQTARIFAGRPLYGA
jgi:glycosyltransferase involved in cell wall biosynthesis